MQNILLQTTIENDPDGWHIGRFSRLNELLSQLRNKDGQLAFQVTARNRARRGGKDPLLSNLHELDFDQLWLLAVDEDGGLTADDCAGISRFRQRDGGLIVARNYIGQGSFVSNLCGAGTVHPLHSHPLQYDEDRHCFGNRPSANVAWHGYNSGADGEFQRVRAVGHIHLVMRDRHSPTGVIRYLPAYPHEGIVNAPPGDANARVIMEGQNQAAGRRFNIAVAFERAERSGRAIAQSSFHHFADHNWNPVASCPSTATEPAGDAITKSGEALRSTMQYVRNIAFWLSA
jgi:hypothetical protein